MKGQASSAWLLEAKNDWCRIRMSRGREVKARHKGRSHPSNPQQGRLLQEAFQKHSNLAWLPMFQAAVGCASHFCFNLFPSIPQFKVYTWLTP